MKIVSIGFIALLLLAACSSVPKEWQAMDGSKADGKVILSYLFRPILDTPPVNDQGALNIAMTKCKAWGYSSASAFGAETKSCHSTSTDKDGNVGCVRLLIQKVYQCEN
jgi:hypothetical protein